MNFVTYMSHNQVKIAINNLSLNYELHQCNNVNDILNDQKISFSDSVVQWLVICLRVFSLKTLY